MKHNGKPRRVTETSPKARGMYNLEYRTLCMVVRSGMKLKLFLLPTLVTLVANTDIWLDFPDPNWDRRLTSCATERHLDYRVSTPPFPHQNIYRDDFYHYWVSFSITILSYCFKKIINMPHTLTYGTENAANKAIGGVPTIHYFDFQSRGRGQAVRLMLISRIFFCQWSKYTVIRCRMLAPPIKTFDTFDDGQNTSGDESNG